MNVDYVIELTPAIARKLVMIAKTREHISICEKIKLTAKQNTVEKNDYADTFYYNLAQILHDNNKFIAISKTKTHLEIIEFSIEEAFKIGYEVIYCTENFANSWYEKYNNKVIKYVNDDNKDYRNKKTLLIGASVNVEKVQYSFSNIWWFRISKKADYFLYQCAEAIMFWGNAVGPINPNLHNIYNLDKLELKDSLNIEI